MAQRAKLVLTFGNVVEGDSITLNLNGAPRTFVCAWETDEEYYPFLPGEGMVAALALEQTILSVYGDSYTCTVDGTQLTVEPIYIGNKYNFGQVLSDQDDIFVFSQQDNISDPLTLSAVVTDVRCFGTPTGRIDLTVAGGATAKTFLWSDGSTDPILAGILVGTYSVTVTDEDGTTASLGDLVVSQPAAPLNVVVEKQDVSQFSGTDGGITLTVTGGTPAYSYAWADGATTKDRPNIPAGTYSVQVTDSRGCSVSLEIVISQPDGLEVIVEVDFDAIRLTVIGGVAPYSFAWNDGATTKDRSGLEPGVYTCTITDSQGATASVTVTLSADRFYFSKNPIPLRLQATDLGNKPNLSFICEVWIERDYLSGIFERVGIPLEQPADRDGGTVFNVQEVLDGYLKPFFPEFGQNYISLATGAFKRFYLQHTERFGDIPEDGLFTQISQNYVVLGGISDEEFTAGSFGPYLNAVKPFFTWDPTHKAVFEDQPEYLFYLPLMDGIFQVRAQITFTDGTLATVTQFTQEAFRHELYCLPTGYTQLGLATVEPGKKVRNWRVSVVDVNGDSVSETRTYTLESEFYQHRRYFLYLNSIGGVNSLACTGAAKKNLETEAQQIDRPLGLSYDPGLGDVQVSKKYGKPVLSVSSGYKTRQYMEALQDFEISPMVRLVGKDRYIPGMVATRRAPVLDEMKTLNSLSFDFVLPKMYRYTPEL